MLFKPPLRQAAETLPAIFMRKSLLTILVLTIVHVNVIGQSKKSNNYSVKIDTLFVKSDSLLAKIFTYNNDILVKEEIAFLFHDSIRISRFRFARNIFKKTIYVDRILKHGKNIEYTSDLKKKITEFNYGVPFSTLYYDKNNNEISKEQFFRDKLKIGPCGLVAEEYLIRGRKKN